MAHKWTECKLSEETKIVTSVVSYEYTCLLCNETRRYAYPELGESVFCNGEDFGTRTVEDIDNDIRIHNVISQLNFNDRQLLLKMRSYELIDPENNYELDIIKKMCELGILEKAPEIDRQFTCIITEFGQLILGNL